MTAFRHYEKAAQSKAELRELNNRLTSDIHVGIAIVPYDKVMRAWVLPDGPQQKNRYVTTYAEAYQYAQKINDILGHYPQLAIRLARKEAA